MIAPKLRSIVCFPVVLPLVTAICALMPAARTQALTLTVLHTFDAEPAPTTNSIIPNENDLLRGTDGNFYGARVSGGTNGTGTIFRLTPAGTFTTLYNFGALANTDSSGKGTNGDGAHPSSLAPAADGSFYGVTSGGGARYGTFFRITAAGNFSTLYTFGSTDPVPNVHRFVQGRDGNLYGTSSPSIDASGLVVLNGNGGAILRFTPDGVLTVAHQFNTLATYSYANDGGANPNALTLGSDGNFYGTTQNGGVNGTGTIFKATPAGDVTTLHSFNGFKNPVSYGGANTGGAEPIYRLTEGSNGSFYGSTTRGSSYDRGNIFRITPDGVYTVLYAFGTTSDGMSYDDGAFGGNMVQGTDGNLYGTTSLGSGFGGLIFEIPSAGSYRVLYSFTTRDPSTGRSVANQDGTAPNSLVEGSNGIFYGMSFGGGASSSGTSIQLDTHPAFFAGEVALSSEAYYLSFPGNGNTFGYYQYLSDPRYIYHFDLGFEYVFDTADGSGGVFLYDFKSNDYFYTSPTFPFPYLYDFGLQAFLYYYPDPKNPQRYNTDGKRYFYNFSTGKIISK